MAISPTRLVNCRELREWTVRVLESIGTPVDIADDVAEVLVASDRRGIPSHGTARLDGYVARVEAGVMDPRARPTLRSSSNGTASFDAHNGWGPHAGRVAVDWAVDVAARQGLAMAVVAESNHFGIAGWYALRAVARGFIGVASCNTAPFVAPTRASRPLIGTNPIAIAAPAGEFGSFCLDMATSVVPKGRIEVAARLGQELPDGWALGPDGYPARTPESALGGALLPLGGGESTGGHKGYALALAVDILTGVLAGTAYGANVRGLYDTAGPARVGHAFIVIDPGALDRSGGFQDRLKGYCELLVDCPTAPGADGRVLVPGEPESIAERQSDANGIEMDQRHRQTLEGLGRRLNMPFPG